MISKVLDPATGLDMDFPWHFNLFESLLRNPFVVREVAMHGNLPEAWKAGLRLATEVDRCGSSKLSPIGLTHDRAWWEQCVFHIRWQLHEMLADRTVMRQMIRLITPEIGTAKRARKTLYETLKDLAWWLEERKHLVSGAIVIAEA